MTVKFGLRDTFRQADFRDMALSPLERIGALYYQGMQREHSILHRELRDVLLAASSTNPEEQMLALHAAVMLAQNGQSDGVDYILSLLRLPNQDTYTLAETALRNCNQFPFAALVAQAIEIEQIIGEDQMLSWVMRRSEDDLLADAKRLGQETPLQEVIAQIQALNMLPRRAGRNLAVGTIVGCPVRTEERYRYSGFVAIERDNLLPFQEHDNHLPLVVPFNQGDVLNRNDSHAFQDIDQLLRRPGRRVVLVYATIKPYEVQQMYILPFAAQSERELQPLLSTLARGTKGLRVGVTIEVLPPRGYRVIIRDGAYHWETFRTENKHVGSCVFYHELNSRSLSTDLSVKTADVSEITRDFRQNTQLDQAVWVKSHKSNRNKHMLVSRQGNTTILYGEVSPQQVYYLDQSINKDGKETIYPFALPDIEWMPIERARILAEFLQYHPETYGVVLDHFLHDNTALARVVHLQSGQVLRVPCNEEVAPGTLAYCEPNETNILSGYRIEGSCLFCFGTTQRICTACDGKEYSVCPDCGGSQRVQCFECNNGNISCERCGGTGVCKNCTNGYRRNGESCLSCQATGRCKSCKPPGSGHWNCGKCHGRATLRCGTCHNGTVNCSICDGLGISHCDCGSAQGVIVAL